eukprot:3372332-Rhodomonas_salina.2
MSMIRAPVRRSSRARDQARDGSDKAIEPIVSGASDGRSNIAPTLILSCRIEIAPSEPRLGVRADRLNVIRKDFPEPFLPFAEGQSVLVDVVDRDQLTCQLTLSRNFEHVPLHRADVRLLPSQIHCCEVRVPMPVEHSTNAIVVTCFSAVRFPKPLSVNGDDIEVLRKENRKPRLDLITGVDRNAEILQKEYTGTNPTGPRLEEIADRSIVPMSLDVVGHRRHSVQSFQAVTPSEKSIASVGTVGMQSSNDSCQPDSQTVCARDCEIRGLSSAALRLLSDHSFC